jgi:hypothetical protein
VEPRTPCPDDPGAASIDSVSDTAEDVIAERGVRGVVG